MTELLSWVGSIFTTKESEIEKSVLRESISPDEEDKSTVDMNGMNKSIEYADGNSHS